MESTRALPGAILGSELDEICALVEERSAIYFDASRERFFSAHVNQYLVQCGEPTVAGLLARLRGSAREYERFLESVLTQETSFFRYPDVVQVFEQVVLPEMQTRKFWNSRRTLRIWSAGCSSGEEPYSLAVSILDVLQFSEAWEIEILATDISRDALRQAERGVYAGRSLSNVTPGQLKTHFAPKDHGYQVKPRVRKLISFAQMNLAQSVYVGRMDCIFCMNVLMYFSEERRRNLIQRFYECLEPGGFFFLGHAESLNSPAVKFERVVSGGCQYYVKPGGSAAATRPASGKNA